MNDWIFSENGEVRRSDARSEIKEYLSSVVHSRVSKEYLESENAYIAVAGVLNIDRLSQTAQVEFELNDYPVTISLNDLVVVHFEGEEL